MALGRRPVAELALPLSPQHLTPPALVSAQVWWSPAAIAVTPLVRPVTATGAWRSVVVPSPSWPLPLLPQHLTAAGARERAGVVRRRR